MDDRDDPMDRPFKRPRLSLAHESAEDVPEDLVLQTARARNDMRLKSIFEGIFEKYGKDFAEVGDEIDLQSGDIVVDNGHLVGMQTENDTGDKAQAWLLQTGLSAEPEDPTAMENDYDDNSDDGGHEDLGDDGYNELHSITDRPDAPSTSNPHDNLLDESVDPRDDRASSGSQQDSALAYKDTGSTKTRQPVTNTQHVDQLLQKEAGATDPLWQVPEIDAKFSTPTWNRNSHADITPRLPSSSVRSVSPPGAGSLWAIPRRGRPRTEGKPMTTPSKRQPQAKRKHHSSPVIRDWSFANNPDGSESDDPLQEFEHSPTLKKMNVKSKRKDTTAPTHSHCEVKHEVSTSMQPTAYDEPSVAHDEKPTQDDSKHSNLESHTIFNMSMPHSESLTNSFAESLDQKNSILAAVNTPTRSKRGMTPDEARLIVCLRHVQGKRWKEIHAYLPGRKLQDINAWNHLHWTDRRANPPPLSWPWSRTELHTLARLKDRRGLSWAEIRAEFPHRLLAEIEFEMLRLWVGDRVWYGDTSTESFSDLKLDQREEKGADTPTSQMGGPEKPSTGYAVVSPLPSHNEIREEQDADTPIFPVGGPGEASIGSMQPSQLPSCKEIKKEQGVDMPRSPMGGLEKPSTRNVLVSPLRSRNKTQEEWDQLMDEDDMVLVGGGEVKSQSKLSAIHLESPAPSQKRSRSSTSASLPKRSRLMI